MAKRLFMHIGLPKSGTSYLQALLDTNRDRLAQQSGLLVPSRQLVAVQDLRQLKTPGRKRGERDGAWRDLVGEVAAWSGDAIISMEWLSAASVDEVERAVEDMAPAEVHVVVTARDLGRTVPAAWQEAVKNGWPWTWEEFLESLQRADPDAVGAGGRRFWSQQDLERILATWGHHVPAHRTTVITTPPAGAAPDELWHRLCQVVGVDPRDYPDEGLVRNESMSLPTTETLRRVLPRVRDADVTRSQYARVVNKRLVPRQNLGGGGGRAYIPPEHQPWVRARAEQNIRAIRDAGVHVVGDLDELVPHLDSSRSRQPDQLTTEELHEAAQVLLVECFALLAQAEREADRQQRHSDERISRLRRRNASLRRRAVRLRRQVETLEPRASVRGAVRHRAREVLRRQPPGRRPAG